MSPQTPLPPARVIGIDPGLSGAIAVLDGDRITAVHDMPTLLTRTAKAKGRRDLDDAGLVLLLERLAAVRLLDGRPVSVVLEHVSAAPRDGAVSAFTFGQGFGALRGVIAALRLPLLLVRPTVWKARLRVQAAKASGVALADRLWPDMAYAWRGPRGAVLDGRAEAALIAEYGRRYARGDWC